MSIASRRLVRDVFVLVFGLSSLLATAAPVFAQGVGFGARFAWVRQDKEVDADSVRFTGFQMRALGGKSGLEISFDRHKETFEALHQQVTETPIQVSLLMRLSQGGFSPYFLGGPGWYKRSVEADGADGLSASETDFGWHAGGGVEIFAGKHIGIHTDYRFTFVDLFGGDDDDDKDESFIGGLMPGYKGSTWTLGATFYF